MKKRYSRFYFPVLTSILCFPLLAPTVHANPFQRSPVSDHYIADYPPYTYPDGREVKALLKNDKLLYRTIDNSGHYVYQAKKISCKSKWRDEAECKPVDVSIDELVWPINKPFTICGESKVGIPYFNNERPVFCTKLLTYKQIRENGEIVLQEDGAAQHLSIPSGGSSSRRKAPNQDTYAALKDSSGNDIEKLLKDDLFFYKTISGELKARKTACTENTVGANKISKCSVVDIPVERFVMSAGDRFSMCDRLRMSAGLNERIYCGTSSVYTIDHKPGASSQLYVKKTKSTVHEQRQ